MCCVKQSMLLSSFSRELGLSPFGNYWWRRKPHSLLHIHVDERKAIFMAHAWRPDAAWRPSSRTLGETETEKQSHALFQGGGRLGGEEAHMESTPFSVLLDTWLYCAVYYGWLFCGQHSGPAWKTKIVTDKNEKKEASGIISIKEMLHTCIETNFSIENPSFNSACSNLCYLDFVHHNIKFK